MVVTEKVADILLLSSLFLRLELLWEVTATGDRLEVTFRKKPDSSSPRLIQTSQLWPTHSPGSTTTLMLIYAGTVHAERSLLLLATIGLSTLPLHSYWLGSQRQPMS